MLQHDSIPEKLIFKLFSYVLLLFSYKIRLVADIRRFTI
jgi:hypothetical protein